MKSYSEVACRRHGYALLLVLICSQILLAEVACGRQGYALLLKI